jgi:glycerophosphoryl diester phosphodiesterase
MMIIAHRGSSQATPENTLPAIKKAIRDGADSIEIDVQLTKDQHPIVIHDEWLNRTTNGNGFVCDSNYSYISELDAGSWFHSSFKNTRIPLLEEVFTIVKQHPIQLNIELKNNLILYPGIEKKVIELIQEYQLDSRIILSSFRKESLYTCKEVAPHIRRGFLCWTPLQSMIEDHELELLEPYSIHPHISFVTSHISKLQQKGFKIYPYVIERKRDLSLCLQHNVDGLFTNCPGRVKQILTRKN